MPNNQDDRPAPPHDAPAASDPTDDRTDWWTPTRLSIHAWLQQNAPVLAPLYEAAVPMALAPEFPGRVCFVAHAVREIRNRLADVVVSEIRYDRADYPRLTEALRRCWDDEGFASDGTSVFSAEEEPTASGRQPVNVSPAFVTAVGDLIAEHNKPSETNRDRVARLFEHVGGARAPDYAIRAWRNATDWAPKNAHVPIQGTSQTAEASLLGWFLEFEKALAALSNRSFENMDLLDDILDSANR